MPQIRKAGKEFDWDSKTFIVSFIDGTDLRAEWDSFNDETKYRLGVHGLSQKVGDSYAGAKDVEEAKMLAKDTIEVLQKGGWGTRVSDGLGRVTLLAEALSRLTKVPVNEVRATLDTLDEDTVKSIRLDEQVKLMVSKIKTERLEAKAEKASAEGGLDIAGLFASTE
jgi:hypothetical protein